MRDWFCADPLPMFESQPLATMHAFAMLHIPSTSGFPPAPAFVKSFLVPYVFYHFHRQVRCSMKVFSSPRR